MFAIKKKPTLFSALKPKSPWGGSHIFTGHLLRHLEEKGWKVTFDLHDRFDVAYATGWFLQGKDLETVLRKAPLLFRMDGLPSLYRDTLDDETQGHESSMRTLAEKASHVVFQSRYCQDICKEWKVKSSSVILNGTDTSIFYPNPARKADPSRLRVAAASWSSNPRKGMSDFKELADLLPEHAFHFMGNWPKELEPGRVTLHAPGDSRTLAAFLRGCDIFIHLAKHDPCPNVVVEAMACGLYPVVHETGGAKELVANGLVVGNSNDVIRQWSTIAGSAGAPSQSGNIHSLTTCGDRYASILRSLLDS